MPVWFEPLLTLLADQPPETTTVTLTLTEVAALASAPVPAGAATQLYWQGRGSSVRRRLAAIGWRVGRLNRRVATITFARLPGADAL